MSHKLNQRAQRMLANVGADPVGDTWVSFTTVTVPLSSKVCRELNEQANDDPDTLHSDE